MWPDSEAMDEGQSSTLKLPLFSITARASMQSPERPGMLTPPLRTSASVPFRWEEEPGKPKPCTTVITLPDTSKTDFSHKCLELPPRLLIMDAANANANNIAKLSSPTTVLEGPYVARSSRFQTPSFRMSSECYGSFRGSTLSPEHKNKKDSDEFGVVVLSNSKIVKKEKGVFGSWRENGLKSNKREVGGGSYVFPSSVDRFCETECSRAEEGSSSNCTSDKITRIRRSGSFTNVSVATARPRFWATIYGGLKQVVVLPWRSRKAKKDGLLS